MNTVLPNSHDTEFTVMLPCDIRPRSVGAGYDWEEGSPWCSFLLCLDLDWAHDAPRILRARLEGGYGRNGSFWVQVPHRSIRLARGGPLAEPDVFDEGNSDLCCNVQFRPLDRQEAQP